FAGITAKPVSEKFPDVFMLEKMKSLVKSCTGSGSEANVMAMLRENIGSKSQMFFCINILC
ncbi:hypothetical protein A2U01_0058025, partial [Trifolium medium]|nr:hypothetical protein [Trifolium medium]